MNRFTTRAAGALVAAAIAFGAGAGTAASAPASDTPTAHASCTQGRVLGRSKCLQAGEFCTHTARANHDYHRYGYHCGRADRNGKYHLTYY